MADSFEALYQLLNKGKQTSSSGGTSTTTEKTDLSEETVNAMLKQALEGDSGLASLLGGQAKAGLYNSSTNTMLVNDLLARVATNVAAKQATTTRTVVQSPQTQVTKNQSMVGKDYAGLLMGMGGKQYLDKFLKNKNPIGSAYDWLSGAFGGASAGSGVGGGIGGASTSVGGLDIGGSDLATNIMDAIAPEFASSSYSSSPGARTAGTSDGFMYANTANAASSLGSSTSVQGLDVGTSVPALNLGTTASTEGTFGNMYGNTLGTSYTDYAGESSIGTIGAGTTASNSGAEYTFTSAESAAAPAATDVGPTQSSSSSGGSYLSTATGAYAGLEVGKRNYETDPAMQSGEDGFGTYHHDARAEIGGGILGGVMGYYGGAAGSALAAPVVDWFHPYAQDMTRDVIMAGDELGGAAGAFALDPIGAAASGKYSDEEVLSSQVGAAIAPVGPWTDNVTSAVEDYMITPVQDFFDDNCFITTAVCKQLGKSDSCLELVAMRKLRDEYALTQGYKDEVEHYYKVAPKIVEVIRKLPTSDRIFNDFYDLYIVPAVSAVVCGNYEKAHIIYKALVEYAENIAGLETQNG